MQTLNASVVAEGGKKVDVLKATKDFKKGIYSLQWEHTYTTKEVSVYSHCMHVSTACQTQPSNMHNTVQHCLTACLLLCMLLQRFLSALSKCFESANLQSEARNCNDENMAAAKRVSFTIPP